MCLTLWVRIPLRLGVLDTTLSDKVNYALGQVGGFIWLCILVYSTNKTDLHDIIEILLKVALNIITITIKVHVN
jgi:hypothetical protein